jgi:hypothetical protein
MDFAIVTHAASCSPPGRRKPGGAEGADQDLKRDRFLTQYPGRFRPFGDHSHEVAEQGFDYLDLGGEIRNIVAFSADEQRLLHDGSPPSALDITAARAGAGALGPKYSRSGAAIAADCILVQKGVPMGLAIGPSRRPCIQCRRDGGAPGHPAAFRFT